MIIRISMEIFKNVQLLKIWVKNILIIVIVDSFLDVVIKELVYIILQQSLMSFLLMGFSNIIKKQYLIFFNYLKYVDCAFT